MNDQGLQNSYNREQICEILRSDLIAGKFNYNEPLRESSLAKRFNVSRGPIRDAFLRLTQGVRVHSAIADDEREVMMKMRLELESYCIAQYIIESGPQDHAKLKLLLQQFKNACGRESLRDLAQSDLSLHRHWVSRASTNLEPIWLGLAVRILMKYSRLASFEESIKEHEKIVEAILLKNVKSAIDALSLNLI